MTRTGPRTERRYERTHIIVADDSKSNLLVLEAMLKKMGLCPATAVDGIEAVALAEIDVPRLILMDINMPRMNGIEAAITIRARHPNVRIPIVAVTAYPDSRHQGDYALAEFDSLIAKPVNMTTLKRVVTDYLGDATAALG
ncbi:response regulator [Palleronia abyssalis]|uniref:Polar-differentiation response regulator DivK n=1 Tax=Palleronia abyssalis TaxID=1501240 RepID=A0A2R8BRG4_9RHOB|nr:response regulator [Palleronia abyssalis]SPJ22718.1 Polar-differentiation response regulator DivK [Palleronia abyssalis]